MARVPYIDVGKDALNIRRALANSPTAGPKNTALAMHIRNESKLDPRLREMAILQVGYTARCAYEYVHHIELGREFGVSDDDIRAIAEDSAGRPTKLDPLAKAVLRAAREMTVDCGIADDTFAVLKQHLDNERIVDLVLAVAFYNSTVRILESLKVDVEPGYQRYLQEFPLPPR
ncbi:MAG TPA: carboxymuconolactone decarboxylase family protein [Stellaceae bacterium]|nr:carboxymuconolactone decarboxylase family protein [Stellaceae bacterium]